MSEQDFSSWLGYMRPCMNLCFGSQSVVNQLLPCIMEALGIEFHGSTCELVSFYIFKLYTGYT